MTRQWSMFVLLFIIPLITDSLYSSLVYWPPAPPSDPDSPEAPEDTRRRQLLYTDPVHSVNLINTIRDHLKQTIQAVGEAEFQQEWLANVDKDVVSSFGQLGIL